MIINLKNINVYILTIPQNSEKLKRLVSQIENKISFEIFYGISLPRPIGCDISLIKLWNKIKLPALILEDDCCITEFFKTEIDIPDNADVVHIGTSGWGVTNQKSEWNNFTLTKYNDDYYKICGMTGTHGMLFLTDRYLKSLIGIGEKYPVLCDVGGPGIDYYTCQEQYKYNVYGVANPLVYQTDPHTIELTTYPLETIYKSINKLMTTKDKAEGGSFL